MIFVWEEKHLYDFLNILLNHLHKPKVTQLFLILFVLSQMILSKKSNYSNVHVDEKNMFTSPNFEKIILNSLFAMFFNFCDHCCK